MYKKIKDQQPELKDCFFAFSEKQLEEGLEKTGLKKSEVYNGAAGLIGTREGIKAFYGFYENQTKEIAEKCSPQEVYDYEFCNHECSYVGDDQEAIQIVVDYFGRERAKEANRSYAYTEI